jgi:SpoVK/Ycf46/Vps4 family AAA+-type ATPase
LADNGQSPKIQQKGAASLAEELDVHLRARFPLVVLVSLEEERVLDAVKSACKRIERPCLSWDMGDGFQVLSGGSATVPTASDPFTALEQIERLDYDAVFVLKDFHDCWAGGGGLERKVRRKMRGLAQRLKFTKKTIFVTSPVGRVPDELRDEAVVLEVPPPGQAELENVLGTMTQNPAVRVQLTDLGREKLVQAALGLTASQARRTFSKAIIETGGTLDDRHIELVVQEKKSVIRESEALEFYSVTETLNDVGGLEVLKDWLRLREQAFTQEARDYGLPAPKGIALIGIPGTGKSLTAKMIGGLWRLPLLRLDVGALFGSLVGEAEERTRRALRLAETVAPCVLWIDEMEKAFAHGGGDAGTSTRVFGSILTWMQDKTAPCFVVGTANDISTLPTEVLRKGRFDEIFFLDLPTEKERSEIVSVHLTKRHRLPRDFDIESLAASSAGYVGAEIEQAVIDAMYVGFADRHREITTEDIRNALARQVPLSVSQRERITALREWLKEGRAQSASFAETVEAEREFVPLEL